VDVINDIINPEMTNINNTPENTPAPSRLFMRCPPTRRVTTQQHSTFLPPLLFRFFEKSGFSEINF